MSIADANTSFETAASPRKSLSGEVIAFLIAVVLLALWGLSVFTFGIPGLYIPAVAAVPVVYLLLLVITRG